MREILAAGLVLLLAGCTAGTGDLTELSYEGRDSGSHQERADCDDSATLAGTGNVEDGTLTVRVTDGSGEEAFSRSFDGGIDLEGERLQGASGTWTMTATRSGDDLVGDEFNGQYTFGLTC
jgi:hypothetical protein